MNTLHGRLAEHVGRTTVAALVVAVVAGCAAQPVPSRAPAYHARAVPAPAARSNGAIYAEGTGLALFNDVKARRVGDLLTIQLVESTSASKSAKTSAKKSQDTELDPPVILGQAPSVNGAALTTSLKGSRDFGGEGDSSQSNRLAGFITVTVVERLPNGNLVIEGEKHLTLNQGDETVRIAGIVRPTDISTGNVVPSYKVADAQISYNGRGFVAESNRMGWLARFFNSGWSPW